MLAPIFTLSLMAVLIVASVHSSHGLSFPWQNPYHLVNQPAGSNMHHKKNDLINHMVDPVNYHR